MVGITSAGFIRDLEVAFRGCLEDDVSEPSDEEYLRISAYFDGWRKTAKDNLLRIDLKPGDPLLCPVSLLGTIDFGRLETAHTRTLAWLLNPGEAHGFGHRLVFPFLKRVFGNEAGRDPRDIEVESERPVSDLRGVNLGRLDILLRGTWTSLAGTPEKWVVLVEAKIDAEEGELQCERYERAIESSLAADHNALVFLTPVGIEPTTEKIGKWQKMSFLDLACLFRNQLPSLTGAVGYDFLRLYLAGVFRDLYHWSGKAAGHETQNWMLFQEIMSLSKECPA